MRRVRGVLVVEGVQTGDGRVIADGALTWAELPLPLGWLVDGDQHADMSEMCPQVGIIEAVTRAAGGSIEFTGQIDDGQPNGAELVRRMEAGMASNGARQLVSIDPDNYAVQLINTAPDDGSDGVIIMATGRGPAPTMRALLATAGVQAAAGDPDPGDGSAPGTELLYEDRVDSLIARFTMLRIRGATACAVSAFTEAYMELEPADAVPAEPAPTQPPAVAASALAVPARPPAPWFALPEPEPGMHDDGDLFGMPVQELLVEQPDGGLAVPLTITDDGRVFGHIAHWGQCHTGYPGTCVTPPESMAAYAHFHHGSVVCDDGAAVATGVLTMGCDHAAAELRAPEARDHYAHSGLGFADVRATNGAYGIWACGALRPDVDEVQLRALRASSPSGDWRRIDGHLELIAALAVNVPGFPTAREVVTAGALPDAALVASAWIDDGVQQSLVAAGIVQRCPECARRAALAASGRADGGEQLELLRTLELRTRHLVPAARDAMLAAIRG